MLLLRAAPAPLSFPEKEAVYEPLGAPEFHIRRLPVTQTQYRAAVCLCLVAEAQSDVPRCAERPPSPKHHPQEKE